MEVTRELIESLHSVESNLAHLAEQLGTLMTVISDLHKQIAELQNEQAGFRVGNRVRVNYGSGELFCPGDTGIVTRVDADGDLWVDFSESQVGRGEGDKIWCVDSCHVTSYEDDER